VLLENPEAHLHPKGQTEIGKFIALCADNGINVIVETHSDHLFDGVRLYIKQHPDFAEKFISYWFQQNQEKNTEFEYIILNREGRLANSAPKGFFDQFEIDAMELF
jgi:predicted ATPase